MSEREIGIWGYISDCEGTGGRLKVFPEDFVVEEIPAEIPEDPEGKYTLAFVRSRNWETNRLVRNMARAMGISRKRIYFAGTKDKRAVTTQVMVFNAPMEEVLSLRLRDVSIIKAYRVPKPVFLGDLIGNRFEVLIRDVKKNAGEFAECTGKIIERYGGFPNFFGVQRFGSVRPITHLVGKYLVKGDFRMAVETYLGNPSELEGEDACRARKFFEETGDVAESLKIYPKHLMFERAILNHLASKPGDYGGAFRAIPENLSRMFVHAYQSYLFNVILSRRIEEGLFGKLVVGDIVMGVEGGMPVKREIFMVKEHNLEKIKKRIRERKAVPTGIVFGSEPYFAEGRQGEIEREVIEGEGIKPEDFVFEDPDFLTSRGNRRALMSPVHNLNISFNGESLSLSFYLPKGCYATSMLREFMKVEDLTAYG